MRHFVCQSLTNCDVSNSLAYGETRRAPYGSDCSGAQARHRIQEDRAELPMTAQQYTIAVVDDDPGLLRALGRLLAESGYRVELFASFGEVLSRIPNSKAMCILIDCQLGQFSGIELARQLTASGVVLPIIFMTASDDDEVRQQAMTLGCSGFLQKPFFIDQLLEAVGKASNH